MNKSQCRNMKHQGNNSHSKANNSRINNLNNSEEEEISNKKFRKTIRRTINEIKEVCKQQNKFKQDTNNQLSVLKKFRELKERKKIMQDVRDEFNKDRES
jgi:predicted RNA binding protein with dsRBD fold (UPF0201 family)